MIVKLSHIVSLYEQAKKPIEKAMLDTPWTLEDEQLLRYVCEQIAQWGDNPEVTLDFDVPMGLGDKDALIRFFLSLSELFDEQLPGVNRKSFQSLLSNISPDIVVEVSEEIFND